MELITRGRTRLTLHAVEWGTPDDHPVILLHGLRGYGRWFDGMADELAATRYVVAPDLRGRGASGHSEDADYRVESMVDDLEDLIAALGASLVTLVGHSLGGIIALSYAARHPEKVTRMVVADVSPVLDESGMERTRLELQRTPMEFASWDEARAFIAQRHRSVRPERHDTRVEWMLKDGENGTVVWRTDSGIFTGPIPGDTPARMWRWLDLVECPTLIMKGGRSDIVPTPIALEMVAALPEGSEFAEIPDAGHMIMDDNPQDMTEAVREFIAREA